MSAVADNVDSLASNAVSRTLTKFAAARGDARKFHREIIGDVDPEYSFGDFLLLVSDRNDAKLEKRYGSYRSKAALSAEGGGSVGGYLVPQELREDLMGVVESEAIIRPRATVVPMGTNTLDLPYWDASSNTTKGIAPFWGGLQMQFTAEGDALAESEPKMRQLSLKAHELGGVVLTSAPLMQDAKGLEGWLRLAFGRSLAWYEDWYFINGTGAGTPQGLVGCTCAITVSRATAGKYSAADGQAMISDFYSPNPKKGIWLFSTTAGADVVSQAGWRTNGGMKQYGMKVFMTLFQPAVGTTGDAILFDPSLYVIGDRQSLEIAASPYTGTSFQQNQWTWRIVERIDGRPLLDRPINVPDGGSSQNSPVVLIA